MSQGLNILNRTIKLKMNNNQIIQNLPTRKKAPQNKNPQGVNKVVVN